MCNYSGASFSAVFWPLDFGYLSSLNMLILSINHYKNLIWTAKCFTDRELAKKAFRVK